MHDGRSQEEANSFGKAADQYERSRPTYPRAASDWLVGEYARVVLDLAAGTGKFTRSLVERGLEVIAVEPSAEMRERLEAALPGVTALEGTAEHIPLPDASVDAVTVATAWHWVDEAVAVPEVARVLRPGGTLGLVWNARDDSVGWVRRLGEIIGRSAGELALREQVRIGPPFGEIEQFEVAWSQTSDPESLLALVESRSYIITATEEVRRGILDGVRELLATDPALAGRETFEIPYRALCFRAALPETPIR
jgi:ubiquinone/menaquinone biosynthesis C-methylase UbiE